MSAIRLLLPVVIVVCALSQMAQARSRSYDSGWSGARSCHCNRYMDPNYAAPSYYYRPYSGGRVRRAG